MFSFLVKLKQSIAFCKVLLCIFHMLLLATVLLGWVSTRDKPEAGRVVSAASEESRMFAIDCEMVCSIALEPKSLCLFELKCMPCKLIITMRVTLYLSFHHYIS